MDRKPLFADVFRELGSAHVINNGVLPPTPLTNPLAVGLVVAEIEIAGTTAI